MNNNPMFTIIGCWVLGPGVAIQMDKVAFITSELPVLGVPRVRVVTELGQTLWIKPTRDFDDEPAKDTVVTIANFDRETAKQLLDLMKFYMSNR